jgi:hypothetical protein
LKPMRSRIRNHMYMLGLVCAVAAGSPSRCYAQVPNLTGTCWSGEFHLNRAPNSDHSIFTSPAEKRDCSFKLCINKKEPDTTDGIQTGVIYSGPYSGSAYWWMDAFGEFSSATLAGPDRGHVEIWAFNEKADVDHRGKTLFRLYPEDNNRGCQTEAVPIKFDGWFNDRSWPGENWNLTLKRGDVRYGPELGLPQSVAQAAAWYRMAAENDDVRGMVELGWMYLNGLGVPQDDTQAVAWYRMAAQKGDPEGMNNLGSMYGLGRGVARDDGQAVAWYRKAAEKGYPLGMNNLGGMYEEGRGVVTDMAAAVAWYRKAAALGSEEAKAYLKRLGQ